MMRIAFQRLKLLAQALLLANLLTGSITPAVAAFSVGPFTNSNGPALDNMYARLRTTSQQPVGVDFFADSIVVCAEQVPCGYGPYLLASSPTIAFRNEIGKRFGQYSAGFKPPFRLVTSNVVDGGDGGYVATSCTVVVSTLLGPQESGVSLNGGSLLNCSNSGGVLTINVGQAWSAVWVACVQGTGTTGWTPIVGGVTQSNICTSTSGSATGIFVKITNPTSIATQGSTPSTLTFTSLGTTSYFGGYDAVTTTAVGGVYTSSYGAGGISSPWFAGASGLVWAKLEAANIGPPALCVIEDGENSANAASGPESSATEMANLQVIATWCQSVGASVQIWVPPPYSNGANTAAYTTLQLGQVAYAQAQNPPWDIVIMGDRFYLGGITQGLPNFANQNASANQVFNCVYGLLNCADYQHPGDWGSWVIFEQEWLHLFGVPPSSPRPSGQAYMPGNQITLNATDAVTSTTGATVTDGTRPWSWPLYPAATAVFDCWGVYQAAATTGALRLSINTGVAATVVLGELEYWTNATGVAGQPAQVSVTALATLTTSTVVNAATTNYHFHFHGSVVNGTSAGTFTVAAATPASTLNIQAGSFCRFNQT